MGGGEMKSKQVLSIEQMQHLQELGLELKPSLMHYYKIINADSGKWYLSLTFGDISEDSPTYQYIPAYTLQDVLDALPEEVKYKRKYYIIEMWKRDNEWTIGYLFFSADDTLDVLHLHDETNKSFIDAAYEMLCWCIENGHVNTKN